MISASRCILCSGTFCSGMCVGVIFRCIYVHTSCSVCTVSLPDQVHSKTDLLKQVDDKMVEVNTKNHELK